VDSEGCGAFELGKGRLPAQSCLERPVSRYLILVT